MSVFYDCNYNQPLSLSLWEMYDHGSTWEEIAKKAGMEYALDLFWLVGGLLQRNLNANSRWDLDWDPTLLCDVMSSNPRSNSKIYMHTTSTKLARIGV